LFANNQRSLFLFLLVDAPIVLLLGKYGRRLLTVPIWIVLAIVPAFLLAGSAFVARVHTLTDSPQRVIVSDHLVAPLNERVIPAVQRAPLGGGLGVAAPGVRFLSSDPAQTTPESFAAGVVDEVGVPGLVAYAAALLTLGVALARNALLARTLEGRRMNAAMLAVLLWVLQLAVTYEPLSYFPFAPFFWLLAGAALGLGKPRAVETHARAAGGWGTRRPAVAW
jgi:hypothetical protein